MEDLPKRSHLHERNGHFYLRIRVPVDLAEQYHPQEEIKRSLKTKDRKEANLRLSIELLKIEEEFQKKRRQAANTAVSSSRAVPLQSLISKIDLERAVLVWHKTEATKSALEDDQLRLGLSEEDRETILDNLKEDLAAYSSTDESVYIPAIQSTATKILAEAAIEKEALNKELRLYFYGLIRQARVEQIFESFERFGESFQRTPSVIFSKTQHSTLLKEHTSHCDITLQELLNKFIKAKRSDGAEESTIKGYKLTLDFLIELFGAKKPINLITRDDCREFRDKIAKVPSNARKIYRDSTLLESIERRIKDNKPVLSVTTVNGQIKTLSTILNFAVREGLLQESPAKGLQTLKQKKSKTKRGSFTKEDLAKIFAHPLYTGCIDDEYNYNKPGKNKPRNHRFWVPLISLFTGMRLNEICQLFVSDIQLIDDVHVIQVRVDEDETKKLKTDHSERTVPISKKLIEIGFLDYAEKIRETGDIHLFPDIPISAEGSRSALVTKWFARFLTSAKAKRPETCFHSFRHTFRDECRANDITKEIVGQICGWKSSDDVMDSYGKGYELKRLQEEINKIHKNLILNL